MLDETHGGHLGVVKMKALARGHVWWPIIDQDIEFSTKNCDGCRQVKHDPKLTPVHPWEFPEGPWRRVHIDFAGPFEGKQFLVAVDFSPNGQRWLSWKTRPRRRHWMNEGHV